MKKAQIKQLEKIAAKMQKLQDEFLELSSQSKLFNYSSNANFAVNRVIAANDIVQQILKEQQ